MVWIQSCFAGKKHLGLNLETIAIVATLREFLPNIGIITLQFVFIYIRIPFFAPVKAKATFKKYKNCKKMFVGRKIHWNYSETSWSCVCWPKLRRILSEQIALSVNCMDLANKGDNDSFLHSINIFICTVDARFRTYAFCTK